MTELWDTTIRLLSQEPLARHVGSATLLELAGTLDRAGFGCLEVSGGGCFDWLVEGGVESPWERIRALDARCSTPLGDGPSRSLPRRLAAARAATSCAASSRAPPRAASTSSGSTIPLNDVSNLVDAVEACTRPGRKPRSVSSTTRARAASSTSSSSGRSASPELGPSRIIVNDPAGSLDAAHARELVERVRRGERAACRSVLPGCRRAGARRRARGGARRCHACRLHDLSRSDHALPSLGRGALAVARRHRARNRCRHRRRSGRPASSSTPRSETFRCRRSRRATPSAQPSTDCRLDWSRASTTGCASTDCPTGSTRCSRSWLECEASAAGLRSALRSRTSSVLRRCSTCSPLSGGRRSSTRCGSSSTDDTARRRARSTRSCAGPIELTSGEALADAGSGPARRRARGRPRASQRARRSSCCSPSSARTAEMLLRTVRARAQRRGVARGGRRRGVACRPDSRADRPRAGVRDRRGHDRGRRDARHRAAQRGPLGRGRVPVAPLAPVAELATRAPVEPQDNGVVRVESPMVGLFYRAPQPGADPFVEVGDTVAIGQTLCILEAMKLMNEVKAELEAVVRGDPRRERAPGGIRTAPVRARAASTLGRSTPSSLRVRVRARSSSPTAARSRSASIRACRELGIETVAVYSTADRDSLHVELADRAVCIGPPAPAASYLSIPSIIGAAETTRLPGDPSRATGS